MSFSGVRLDGGGCCNVLLYLPGPGLIIGGSDTQGYYVSANKAKTWTVQNTGIGVRADWRQCGALLASITETSPQVLYSLTGEAQAAGSAGNSGGLLAGTLDASGNITWLMRATLPQAGANHTKTPLPTDGWKRSTGRLLVQDSLYLFAGTYQQGILRSSNTGTDGTHTGAGYDNFPTACTMGGAAPGTGNWFCRVVVPDPASSTTLWAGFYDSTGTAAGLWKCTNAHATTPNFIQVATGGGPNAVEDIFALGDYLYVAAGNQGLYRYGPLSGTPAWTSLNGGSVPTGAVSADWWSNVAGYVDGSSNHVIIGGNGNPTVAAQCLMRLVIPSTWPGTGSITYSNETASVNVATEPSGYTWWHAADSYRNWLGGPGFFCPFTMITTGSPPDIYCSGSEGAFRNLAGAGWQIANSGMPMFLGHPIAANPVHAGHIVFGSSDWCLFDDSSAGSETASTLQNDPPVVSTQGFSAAISADGSTVYAGQGAKYTNSGGEVWSRPWNQPGNWAPMGLKAKTGGKVAIGLAAFDASGTLVVLAAVWASGLWRWDGTSWSNRAPGIATSGGTGTLMQVVYAGGGLCFVFDRGSGIWRSNDYGLSWGSGPVWAKTSGDNLSGTVAYDATRPGRLWVSAAGKLYQLSGADTGTVAGGGITGSGHDVTPNGVTAGPLGTDGTGNIYFATQDSGSGSGLLLTADDGVTWQDITGGDGSFARCNCNPEQMAVGPFEAAAGAPRVYVSGSNVVAWGYPASSAPAQVSAPFTEVQVNQNLLGVAGVLPMWFGAGGAPSTRGNLLIARIETSDGSATITPSDPNWQLVSDVPAGAGTPTARVLTYWYPNNPGGIGGQGSAQLIARPAHRVTPVPAAVPALVGGGVMQGGSTAPARVHVQAPAVIAGTIVPANTATFTSSNPSATLKGKLAEYSSGAGTIQYLDQTGTNSGTGSVTSLPVTAAAGNTYTGGLGIAHFAAALTGGTTGQSWSTPAGWSSDGVGNNTSLPFSQYSQTGLTAGPTSVTGTITLGTWTMTAWAASAATFYALAATPVSITTSSLPDGTSGTAYGPVTLAASGGAPSYSWAVTSGSLPPGLSLSAGGVLSGTPSGTSAVYSFSVTVTDSATQTATASFTISVAGTIAVATSSLPAGTVAAPYQAFLAATGGTSPYTWAIVAGALPPGLALTGGNGPTAGTIAGTPLLAGTFNFTVQATDRTSTSATAALSITVGAGPLTIATIDLAPGVLGEPYFAQFTATGGVPPYHWTLTSGSLPPGLVLNDDGTVTGTLLAAGAYPFTVTVTDS